MRLGCILVLIGVLFASLRPYIHHRSTLIQLNGIIVTWNEFWHYNMRKVGENSLKKNDKPVKYIHKCYLHLPMLILITQVL